MLRCLLLLLAVAVCSTGRTATIVRDGAPLAALVLPADPAPDETLAAQELQEYVEQISGAQLAVGTEAPAGMLPVLIGAAAPEALVEQIQARGTDPASFALSVTPEQVALRGLSPEGTLFAAYELLEQLGVRWFMPGELGTVIPQAKTLTLPEQQTVQVPSFPGRWHNAGAANKQWGRRVRMGGPYFPSSHGINLGKAITFEEHPEYWSLVDGQRVKRQHCVSNPDVIKLAAGQLKAYFRANPQAPWVGIGPNDGSGFCECDNCRALDGGDWDPFSSEPSVTDSYIWFFNQLLRSIEDEFPDKRLCFYAYHTYMRPPVKVKPDPRIVPALAVIALCRIHGPDNPICPEKSYWVWLAREWKKVLPEVYDRGYWFNLADPGFPFSEVHRLRREIPLGKELGLAGWRVETVYHWASETPTMYLAARLMWDASADVDALVADFTEKFFGPARGPMQKYLVLMDEAIRDADYHTGSSFDMPHLYPAPVRQQAERLLNEAARLAGAADGLPARRVRLFRQSFNYLDAFVRMREACAALDFAAASEHLQRVRAIQDELVAMDPPMLNKRAAPAYLRRFFSQAVEQGFERTSGGNRLVAAFADEWQFLLDPQRIGEDIGLWREEVRGPNWQRLKTSSQSWSNQGLRTYKGECWYRQTINVPAGDAGQRVFLWFGGVDEKAKVWVNGKPIGISPGSSFVPFELDATGAVRPGQNVVAVRLVNEVVNELGTGGITAPVMLYAPKDGANATLRNVQEPGRTFP